MTEIEQAGLVDETDDLYQMYEKAWKLHGPTPRGVGWSTHTAQRDRNNAIVDLLVPVINRIPRHPISVLDVGCGTGAMLHHLREEFKPEIIEYTGIDYIQGAVKFAREQNRGKGKFVFGDFQTIPSFPDTYDIVTASGTLNFLYEYDLRPMVAKMWNVARAAVAFNLLSPPNVQLSAAISTVRKFVGLLGVEDWSFRHGYLQGADAEAGVDVTAMFLKDAGK